jgi:hypothetical protein
MLIFPPPYEDPLDVAALPETDETELNYRTRPLSPEQELRMALLVLFVPLPVLVGLATVLNALIGMHFFFEKLVLAIILLLAAVVIIRHAIGVRIRLELLLLIPLAAAFIGGRFWFWIDGANWNRLAILVGWLASCFIARQVAAWILVGPKVDHDTMQRWRVNLPGFCSPQLSLDCPELLAFSVSPLLLVPAWWLAARSAAALDGRLWLWPFLLVGWLHVAWFLLHALTILWVPWPSWQQSWRLAIRALVVFLTYDPYQTRAMGVFRFPTLWVRPIVVRWALIVSLLMVFAFAVAAGWPDPVQTLRQGGSLLGQLLLNLLLVTLAAPLLLLTILWFTAGSMLARFDRELTKKLPEDRTEWDNYVDRIIHSGDKLEADHILVGASQVGDYPVLVHREIYDQHFHVLGDTGASKTSLGIAPTAMQLIARGNSSVVIVDLKGDKALFQLCRREAAHAKLRFRWVSNEVGRTSFVFNPFLQTHNQRLSIHQFVDEILQGLSLDYGIAYGAGYFTAMNQIVLTTLLKHVRVRSFRELDRYLQNQKFYAKIGHAEDWAQARHLGALVSRLSASEAVNVVPGMYPNQPEVQTQAVDALNVFEEPQVVYLSLRSSVEPSNAPAIARLFLWSMFSAANQAKLPEHQRVYFFMDEFQQVIGDGIKLIFEQFRDLGGTIIAAHQTAGQLSRQGTDLGETVDSCTAIKQVYRASNLDSLERLEKLAGNRLAKVAHWVQPYEPPTGDLFDRLDEFYADEGLINVRQTELPALDRQRMLKVSSQRLASLIRFTFGSGYTQFAGASVPIVSQYPISFEFYKKLRRLAWPTAPGAFVVPAAPVPMQVRPAGSTALPSGALSESAAAYVGEFDRRGRGTNQRSLVRPPGARQRPDRRGQHRISG